MLRRILSRALAPLALAAILAACGGSAQAPLPTERPATAAATPAPAASVATTAGGIPEGVTPEGYHYLGAADAPVTMQFYSDFF